MLIKNTIIFGLTLLALANCSISSVPSASDEEQALILVDQGARLLDAGRLFEAQAAFNVAYDIARLSAALDGLGCIAFLRGEFSMAADLFWQAYEKDATYNNSLGNLALLYEQQGNIEKAAELYKRALVEDPKNYQARNNFAGFLNDSDLSSLRKTKVLEELLKAQVLLDHPIIQNNIDKIKGEH